MICLGTSLWVWEVRWSVHMNRKPQKARDTAEAKHCSCSDLIWGFEWICFELNNSSIALKSPERTATLIVIYYCLLLICIKIISTLPFSLNFKNWRWHRVGKRIQMHIIISLLPRVIQGRWKKESSEQTKCAKLINRLDTRICLQTNTGGGWEMVITLNWSPFLKQFLL